LGGFFIGVFDVSGTIPLSMTQQMDQYGDPLAGGKLYFIQAGTVSTPQNAFQDSALTLPWPNPITLDAAARVPQLFLADGFIKVRLTDINGVVQLVADNVQVIGPSGGGGGGGGTIDPTTIYQTGDMKPRYGVGIHTGWVRCNGYTIGSATSGATERANADCQALFNYLWVTDVNLPVSSGRGASAAADWSANKQIGLPDWRGYALGALDDMGNSAAGRLSATYWGGNPIVLGAVGGGESLTLGVTQLPIITPTGTVTVSNTLDVLYPVRNYANTGSTVFTDLSLGSNIATSAGSLHATISGAVTATVAIAPFGGGLAHRTIGPRKLCTFYLKL
jgi:hypothetical protein